MRLLFGKARRSETCKECLYGQPKDKFLGDHRDCAFHNDDFECAPTSIPSVEGDAHIGNLRSSHHASDRRGSIAPPHNPATDLPSAKRLSSPS